MRVPLTHLPDGGTPPPQCEQTSVKTVPSPFLRNAGGKNLAIWLRFYAAR